MPRGGHSYSIKQDHTRVRQRFAKPQKPVSAPLLFHEGKALQGELAQYPRGTEALALLNKSGRLIEPLPVGLRKKEEAYFRKISVFLLNSPVSTLNYSKIAPIGFLLDEEHRQAALSQVIQSTVKADETAKSRFKGELSKTMRAAIAVGLDHVINSPLENLAAKFTAEDSVRYVQNLNIANEDPACVKNYMTHAVGKIHELKRPGVKSTLFQTLSQEAVKLGDEQRAKEYFTTAMIEAKNIKTSHALKKRFGELAQNAPNDILAQHARQFAMTARNGIKETKPRQQLISFNFSMQKTAPKILGFLRNKIKILGKMEAGYDTTILLGFEYLEESMRELKSPGVKSKICQEAARLHPYQEDAETYYFRALNYAGEVTSKHDRSRRLRDLRDHASSEEFRKTAHEMMLNNAPFKLLVEDISSSLVPQPLIAASLKKIKEKKDDSLNNQRQFHDAAEMFRFKKLGIEMGSPSP